MAPGEAFEVFAPVALVRGDETYGAMAMLCVVPEDEASDPGARHIDGGEALCWPGRDILAGPKERFREGVVFGDPRPAEGRDDTEALHGHLHRCAFHSAAIVSVQDPGLPTNDQAGFWVALTTPCRLGS
jgi:hypothetical protein